MIVPEPLVEDGPGICYLRNNDSAASEIIKAACATDTPCVVRVRAVRRVTPNGMPRSFTVLKVYSARGVRVTPRPSE